MNLLKDRVPRVAKKSLGQNFLVNRDVAERIVRGVGAPEGGLVFEIGPGRGALTELMASSGARTVAFEIDGHLAGLLRERFAGNGNIEIINEDVLKVDFDSEAGKRGEKEYRIVGNIPYMLTSSVMLMIPVTTGCKRAVIMVQKEVAERILTPAGERNCGLMTVYLQSFCDVRRLIKVSAGSFSPKPKVDSAVLVLDPVERAGAPGDKEGYFSFLKKAFSARRKQLRNTLPPKGESGGPDFAERLEHLAGIDLSRRAENLSVGEWFALFDAYKGIKGRDEKD